jgi:para-nitrobenzyl esterase
MRSGGLLLCLVWVGCSTDPGPGDGGNGVGCGTASAQQLQVMTDRGPLQGVAAGTTLAFKGIPYAAPPTGALRFQAPADFQCAPAVRDATQFGKACPQLDENMNPVGDEDCLTLNVWTPNSIDAPRAVMVFIHGGGNVQGSSSELASGTAIYDGQSLAEKGDVVVVTLNYRLASLGFLALAELSAEADPKVSGNYGILDQIAALKWVKRNAAAFGGDPTRVMIFGESAGAVNTCVHVASPLSAGLFHAALMQSGGCAQPTLSQAEGEGTKVVSMAGCDGAADKPACLRAIPALTLIKMAPGVASVTGLDAGLKFGPNVDGYVLAGSPIEVISERKHNAVPFVIGANAEETARYTPMVASAMAYEDILRTLFPAIADQLLQLYPAADFPTPRKALTAVTTDGRFVCPARRIARTIRDAQSEPVFRYFFTHGLDNSAAGALGAWHGLELTFIFNQLTIANYMPSSAERKLSTDMIGYWSRLAKAKNPNGMGAFEWPVYDTTTDTHLVLDNTITSGTLLRTTRCDFWDSITP